MTVSSPEIFVIRTGSLGDPSRHKPLTAFWTAVGQSWDHLDPEAVKFERMPAE